MTPEQLVKALRDVFSIEPGASVLKEMEKEISGLLFDENPNRVYYRVGQLELVRKIRMIVDAPAGQINSMFDDKDEDDDNE